MASSRRALRGSRPNRLVDAGHRRVDRRLRVGDRRVVTDPVAGPPELPPFGIALAIDARYAGTSLGSG
ncbi:MAG: hypothetical protein RMJ04_05135 [Geminicoccaceae bacterium]|nr:hypothetical protein [Geminicoccaceae bacterium]